jgi:hypothetical protein
MELTSPVVTTTVALAVAEPAFPVAVAVYWVVFVGPITCDPPVPGKVKLLPSEPATVIWLALIAVTVSVVEPPGGIAAGVAPMATAGVLDLSLPTNNAQPVSMMDSAAMAESETGPSHLQTRAMIKDVLLQSASKEASQADKFHAGGRSTSADVFRHRASK